MLSLLKTLRGPLPAVPAGARGIDQHPIPNLQLHTMQVLHSHYTRKSVPHGWKLPAPMQTPAALAAHPGPVCQSRRWRSPASAMGHGSAMDWSVSSEPESYGCSHEIGARGGAATGPIPAEVRRQEGLKLERTGASPSLANSSYLSIRISAAPPSSASSSLRVESKPPCSCSSVPGQI